MSTPTTVSAVSIWPDSEEDVSRFISIITSAFSETALTTAFIVGIDSTPGPYPSPLIDSARRQRHFSQGILESASSGAELVHAGDWSAVALWETPSYQGKTFIDSKALPPPLLGEWRSKVKQAKAKWLAMPWTSTPPSTDEDLSQESHQKDPDSVQLRPFYHLSFLARNPAKPPVRGSINAVITPFLERAKAENVPAWLEATTPRAARLYMSYGFRVVDIITVGEGQLDAQGWPATGRTAIGVTAYAMIFDDHLRG
jgi:hypothetical protein